MNFKNHIPKKSADNYQRFIQLSLKKKLLILSAILIIFWFIKPFIFSNQTKIDYQTSQVEKGTLIESVIASGSVSSINGISVVTQASGVINKIFVKNGDYVDAGKPIAKLNLDLIGRQKQSQAYSSYLSAKNNFDAANASAYSLRSAKDTAWKKFYDIATSSDFQNNDGTPREDMRNSSAEFQSAQGDWLAAEAKYKNQQAVITQNKVALNAAYLSYQQSQATIIAPMSGTISGLNIQVGDVITQSDNSSTLNSSTSTTSSDKIATIKTEKIPTVSVNLTEIDIVKINIGNKVTITFDAFPDKTYTGKVTAIDTNGSSTSGVISYPVIISLDAAPKNLYPNMSATAAIITQTKDDIIIIPNSAVTQQNNQSTVKIMKNGNINTVDVVTGVSNDNQIEIISGISEGDIVVTGQTSSTSTTNGQTTSPFSSGLFRQGGNFGGNRNNIRISR